MRFSNHKSSLFVLLWQFALTVMATIPAAAQIDLAPANDLFSHRVDLGQVETATVTQPVLRASSELGDPMQDSLWWQWTAPRDGWWEVVADDDLFDYAAGPPIQIFSGSTLQTLVVAEDGGVSIPEAKIGRRLLRAKAGKVYQIAIQSTFEPSYYFDALDVLFTLRPTTILANTGAATTSPLTQLSSTEWTGEGWAAHTLAAPYTTPHGVQFYAPAFWSWTCPASGDYSFNTGIRNTGDYPTIAVFRGAGLTEAAEILEGGFTATAGDVFTFVVGNLYYAAKALNYQHLSLFFSGTPGANIPPNDGNEYPITGALPKTLLPPANAPHSRELYWSWNSQQYGWMEFEGTGFELTVTGISQGTVNPEAIARDGKFYFWATPGFYRLTVAGYQWPAPRSFTLRQATLPVPANDSFASATNLGTGNLVSSTGTFVGATRELGDPAATQTAPRPTLWYRWQPAGVGLAEVFFPSFQPASSSWTQLRVYSGTELGYLTEIPATEHAGDAFTPIHYSFQASNFAAPYYLCFSSTSEDFAVSARLVGSGTYNLKHPGTPVTEIFGREVAEGSASREPDPFSKINIWFNWTAPAAGWVKWTTTASTLEVSKGDTFMTRTPLTPAGYSTPLQSVSAGETLWFYCGSGNAQPQAKVQRLRIQFSEKLAAEPGDDAAAPIDLGSSLPISTTCRMIAMTTTAAEQNFSRESIRANVIHGAWYQWTAPANVSGVEIRGLFTWLDVFADVPGGERVVETNASTAFDEVLFEPQAGRTYFIFLQTIEDNSLNGIIPLTLIPYVLESASNNDFTDAATILPSDGTDIYSGVVASGDEVRQYRLTAESGEPLANASLPGAVNSAWWKWIAPQSGVFSAICLDATLSYLDSVKRADSRIFTLAAYHNATSLAALQRVPGSLGPQRTDKRFYYNGVPPGQRFTFRATAGETYYFQAATSDEFGGISMSILPGDAYDIWAMSFPALDPTKANPKDNPTRDGLSNLLKFGLGLDPSLPLTLDPHKDRAPSFTLSADGKALNYTFWSDRFNTGSSLPFPSNGSPALSDTVRLVAERSSNLQSWSRVSDAQSLGNNQWKVTLPVNGTTARRFVRLRAEWVQPSLPQ